MVEMFDLTGQVCLVTGGGRGLGLGMAQALASAGADVVICGRNQDTLNLAVTNSSNPERMTAITADVGDEDSVISLVNQIIEKHGHIDALINNAGINPYYTRSEDVTLQEWNDILSVNLTGVFLCCKYVGQKMIAAGRGGSIINISSIAGRVGLNRTAAYCASKGGGELLTRGLALDWARHNIRVNTIAPGYFETDLTEGLRQNDKLSNELLSQTPMNRFGTLEDIAGSAVFLASSSSKYITGQTIGIDGGWTAA